MKIQLLVAFAGLAVILAGCKGTNEKRGDDHLEKGEYRNAINCYLDAKNRGHISDEFYDNFTLALVKAAEVEAKKDPSSSLLTGYFEQTMKNLAQVKNQEAAQKIAEAMANVGKAQSSVEGDLGTNVDGFAKIDSAIAVVQRTGGNVASVKSVRTEAENAYVARTLSDAQDEEDPVVREYNLLKIELMAPDNAQLKAALDKSRLQTRPYFLIFGENIGETPSKLIDKWGYVMALPDVKIGPSSLSGELQFWASTGNNTELDVSKIRLVSTKGDESVAQLNAKGKNWCEAEVITGPKGAEKVETKQKPFKEDKKLLNEFKCSVQISFSYSQGFVPDYIEYKDQFGIGRKYLGR